MYNRNIYDIFEERKNEIEIYDIVSISEFYDILYYEEVLMETIDFNKIKQTIKNKLDEFIKNMINLWNRFMEWVDNVIVKMRKKSEETVIKFEDYDASDVFFTVRKEAVSGVYYTEGIKDWCNQPLGILNVSKSVLNKLYDYKKFSDMNLTSDDFILRFTGINIENMEQDMYRVAKISKPKELKTFNDVSYSIIDESIRTYDQAIALIEKEKNKSKQFYLKELNNLKRVDDEEFKKYVPFLTRVFKIHQSLMRYNIIIINKLYVNHSNIYLSAINKYNEIKK